MAIRKKSAIAGESFARLSNATLAQLPKEIVAPAYVRQDVGIGIVHIGPGAFFRGHQAWYTERALAYGGDWAISAVSLQSTALQDALGAQDGLYTLAVIDQHNHIEVIASIKEILVASKQFDAIVARLCAVSTRYVTLTITEKGYCLDAEGQLDFRHPAIVQDIAAVNTASSTIGLLTLALERRRQLGVAPFCVIPCDNLTQNGKKLKAALLAFAERKYPALTSWLNERLICPSTMVDSITPATDQLLKDQVAQATGLDDQWPIKREAFCQWIIEDVLPIERPAWDRVGVVYASDVMAFEQAKLRLLNAPHSALAYLGSLLGYRTVYEAMLDPQLAAFVRRLAEHEILQSFASPKELDANAYSEAIFTRFKNFGIHHLLSQIAWDGSQKLPMRILPCITDNLAAGRPIALLSLTVAAWFQFVRMRNHQIKAALADNAATGGAGETATIPLVDPLAESLLAVADQCTGNADHDVALFLDMEAVFPAGLRTDAVFGAALSKAYGGLNGQTAESIRQALD